MKKIGILLIEDNRILREGLTAMLKKQSDMNVVCIASNKEDILIIVEKCKPDIVLLNLWLHEQNSLKIVKLILEKYKEIKIIVLDLAPLQSDVFNYVKAGVSGFILKDANAEEFYKTIRKVNEGEKVLPPNLTGSLFSQIVEYAISGANNSIINKTKQMTKREKQVVDLIANGLTNKEIAQQLHLSTYTVKSHVHNILEKLSLCTRVQIAKHTYLTESSQSTPDNTASPDK